MLLNKLIVILALEQIISRASILPLIDVNHLKGIDGSFVRQAFQELSEHDYGGMPVIVHQLKLVTSIILTQVMCLHSRINTITYKSQKAKKNA